MAKTRHDVQLLDDLDPQIGLLLAMLDDGTRYEAYHGGQCVLLALQYTQRGGR